MENKETKTIDGAAVFADPVAYLAEFGIEAELVAEAGTPMASAA
jgi:hypothetical protein